MKLVNNNISPLPLYDDIGLQNHRKDYAFGEVYPLMSPKSVILPFQAVLSGGTAITYVRLVSFKSGEYTDITASMVEAGLKLKQYAEFTMLVYPGTLPIVEIKYEGFYYLEISIDGLGVLYSDVFCIKFNVDDLLYIEYRNSYNFELKNGMVDFSDNFKFKMYLNTQLGMPEYDFEEEATERMGYSFIESQVSKKIYKFTVIAPEYLCDAMRIIRLCDTKTVTSKGQTYELTTFAMEPEWQEQGHLAAVECEFETDTVIANIGGYEPEPLGGDYNDDHDNDYYIGEDAGEAVINIRLTVSTLLVGMITATADKAVKSDITIAVTYTNLSGESSTREILISTGNTYSFVQTGAASPTITGATVTKGDSDATIYNVTY